MADSPIRRADAIPLYHQIFLGLRDEIMHGRLPFGTAIPTEHELAAIHHVSRITARRALHELAAHQLVERRRRTGTRVVYRTSTVPIEANVDQAVESLIAFGRATKVKVLDIVEMPADLDTAERLERAAETPVVRARRIRSLDREPLGLVTSWVPADLGVKPTRDALAQTPMLDLLLGAGLVIGGGRQTISAYPASPELSAMLVIEPRATLLCIERVVTDVAGRPLLLTIANYRADRYRISLDLHGGSRDMPPAP